MNHVTHFIGFTILGYGIGKGSLLIIVISPFIMELGHLYNYVRGIHREHAVKIIPLQLIAWLIFVGVGIYVARILGW